MVDLETATVDDLMQAPVALSLRRVEPLAPGDRRASGSWRRSSAITSITAASSLPRAIAAAAGSTAAFRELMQLVFPDEPEYRLTAAGRRRIRSGTRRRRWRRSSCGRCWGSSSAAARAWSMPRRPAGDPRPSLSCLWELVRSGRRQKFSAAVQAQIDAARPIGVNVLAYATNREVKWKDELPADRGRAAPRDKRRPGKDVRGQRSAIPAAATSRPRALVNLMEAAAARIEDSASISTRRRSDITDPALFDYPLVFMHGRNSFHLTDAERRRCGRTVDRGGVLLADSICASRAFTESFRREIAAIFPDHAWNGSRPAIRCGRTYGGFDLRRFPAAIRSPAGDERSAERPRAPRCRRSWKGSASTTVTA